MLSIIENQYYKSTNSEDCEINSGILGLVKNHSIQITPSTSLTSANTEITYDVLAATGSTSAYFYASLMAAYNDGAINGWNGQHKFKWKEVTEKTYVDKRISNKTVSAEKTYTETKTFDKLYSFTIKKKFYGDIIKIDSFKIYDINDAVMFYAQQSYDSESIFDVIPNPSYWGSITSSLTASHYKAWGLSDRGLVHIWSDNSSFTDSLTAISKISFDGILYFNNITLNFVIQPEEFNNTTNKSFDYYNSNNDSNIVNTTYITSVGIWNNYGELLVVARPSNPIRKYIGVPITLKLSFDL